MSEAKEAGCRYKDICGACAFMGMSYDDTASRKEEGLRELLRGICGQINPIIKAEDPYGYRNKINRDLKRSKTGRIKDVIYSLGGTEELTPDVCLIEDKAAGDIIKSILQTANRYHMDTFNRKTGFGLLRGVLIRTGKATGEIMVVLVLGSSYFKGKNNFVKELLKKHPGITTVVTHINTRTDNLILDPKGQFRNEYGKGYITDILLGNVFKISPESFYQINRDQAELLYTEAVSKAGILPEDKVLDAYCGIGTITLAAAKLSNNVTGVDNNKKAIEDARNNAEKNKLKAKFIAKDATEYMLEESEKGTKFDIVIMDPPRAGSTPDFIKAAAAVDPSRIIYVSCNPETLARDLKTFKKYGYEAREATPVDMFPWTDNLETVVLLSQLRQKPDDYIDVDVDVAELEGTSAETKATYEKIKKYVAEHNDGMKVSNLYIAQVKRKCGIELAENFNLPKSEESRQPQCPKEKEEAIIWALKAFKMI